MLGSAFPPYMEKRLNRLVALIICSNLQNASVFSQFTDTDNPLKPSKRRQHIRTIANPISKKCPWNLYFAYSEQNNEKRHFLICFFFELFFKLLRLYFHPSPTSDVMGRSPGFSFRSTASSPKTKESFLRASRGASSAKRYLRYTRARASLTAICLPFLMATPPDNTKNCSIQFEKPWPVSA